MSLIVPCWLLCTLCLSLSICQELPAAVADPRACWCSHPYPERKRNSRWRKKKSRIWICMFFQHVRSPRYCVLFRLYYCSPDPFLSLFANSTNARTEREKQIVREKESERRQTDRQKKRYIARGDRKEGEKEGREKERQMEVERWRRTTQANTFTDT